MEKIRLFFLNLFVRWGLVKVINDRAWDFVDECRKHSFKALYMKKYNKEDSKYYLGDRYYIPRNKAIKLSKNTVTLRVGNSRNWIVSFEVFPTMELRLDSIKDFQIREGICVIIIKKDYDGEKAFKKNKS